MSSAPGGDAEERLVQLVHDLRTPLTIITGFAELLERQGDTLTAEQRDDYLARIAAAARDLGSILDGERDDHLSAD
jgi:signal transduction histidine kinase